MEGKTTNLVELHIEGMNCQSCALRLEKALNELDGVEAAWVSYPLEKAIVRTNEAISGEIKDRIFNVVKNVGFKAYLPKAKNPWDELKRYRLVAYFLFSVPFFLNMGGHILGFESLISPWVEFFISLPVVFYLSLPFYRAFFCALKSKILNMDVLVFLGILIPFLYSSWDLFFREGKNLYYEISVILPLFILVGKYLEAKIRQELQKDVVFAKGFSSQKVRLKNENLTLVKASSLQIGQKILILPGETFPVDGVVKEGSSAVNEMSLTGESLPREKTVGDLVFQGTINLNQPLVIEVKKPVQQSRYMNLIRLTTEAQISSSRIQRFADQIAFYFVPTIIFLAFLVFIFWLSLSGSLTQALERSLAVLVISCPCAFGLSTPISLFVAYQFALKEGILFREASAIERASRVKKIFLDKTGTLTKGLLSLENVEIFDETYKEEEVLSLASSLLVYSNHPLAQAILQKVQNKNLSRLSFREVKEETGLGMRGILEKTGQEIKIGSAKYLKYLPQKMDLPQIFLAVDGQVIAAFSFNEEVRKEAKEVVHWLLKEKYEVAILSGDNSFLVENLAYSLKIPCYKGVSPEEKQQILEKNPYSAMVGDGFNDSLALSKAYLGIALQSNLDPSSLAKEMAQVVFLHPNLDLLPKLFLIAKKTKRNILQNYFWAIFYNTIAIPLAFLGYLSPLIAGLAMSFSSIFVVLNSFFLRRILQKKLKNFI